MKKLKEKLSIILLILIAGLTLVYAGEIDFGHNIISPEPTASNHLTTKNYVDTHITSSGMHATSTPAGPTYSLQYHASGTTFGGSDNLMFYSASTTPELHMSGTSYFRSNKSTTTPAINVENWLEFGNATNYETTLLGYKAGENLTFDDTAGEGIFNTFAGYRAGYGVDAFGGEGQNRGINNTGIGIESLLGLTTGVANTALGIQALRGVTSGNSNFGLGATACDNVTTGSYNMCFGEAVKVPLATGNYQLNIGNAITGDLLSPYSVTSTGRFTAPSGSILNMTSTSIESGSMTTTARFTADSGSILNMTSTNTTSTHIYSTTTTATNMAITGLTSRSIPFIGTGGSVSENTNFVWDNFGSPGRMGVGTSTPKAPFEAMRGTKVTAPIGTNTSDVFKAINYSDNNTVSRAGLFLTHDTQSVNNGNALFAFNAFVYKDTTVNNTATIGYVAGSYAIRMTSVATGGNVKGMAALVTNITPYSNYSATITSAYSLLAEGHTIGTSAGTIENAIGIQQKAHSSSGSGAIRKAYGMILDNQTAGTTINANLLIGTTPSVGNYSIYNNSTYDNYFLGSLGIASTTPSSLFATHGTATILSVTTTRINASDYYSRDGSKGITDNTSYWLCTAADCSTKCQAVYKNGLLTGCL